MDSKENMNAKNNFFTEEYYLKFLIVEFLMLLWKFVFIIKLKYALQNFAIKFKHGFQ